MSSIVATCKSQFKTVFNEIVKSNPGNFDKKEIEATKKSIGLVAKLFADKLKTKEAKKIVRNIKKLGLGGINLTINTGHGKSRDYKFKGKKLDFEGAVIARDKNQVKINGMLSTGEPVEHQFSLKNSKK